MLSLVSPHMQISVLPLLRNSRARSDLFELSRCYSSLLLFVSVHFLYVPCNLFATMMSFNSRKKAECIPCMDYTAISRMNITPIHGENHTILWYDDHTIFGMPSVKSEIIPILV